MPTVTVRMDIPLTLTVEAEARVEFGDDAGTYAIESFKITDIEGVETVCGKYAPRIIFDPSIHEAAQAAMEEALVEEARR